ncbi:MAG: hypothetical protein IJS24_04505, partial [Eubacterium sp.]|nr:hypothetical protein [Eubacterium sp.]
MIIGLGSVGTYLLDFLISDADEAMRIVVVGRSREKMEEKVNIVRIAALIREKCRSQIEIVDGVDLTDISAIKRVVEDVKPDFIVNSSRAYPGLKYGSISWTNFRAYGIWSPLAIRFTKNIMQAVSDADADAIVINTSYSDAVIPWLKSAGKPYPDFGSGNMNHLVPRIRYAVADMLGVEDFWNVDVMFAAGHFHDVVISKEGQAEGVKLPLKVWYRGEEVSLVEDGDISGQSGSDGALESRERTVSVSEIFRRCAIAMPTDTQRNMMNASSNYRIISGIVKVMRGETESVRLFIPGADGHIGGYPMIIGRNDDIDAGAAVVDDGNPSGGGDLVVYARIDESVFTMEEMEKANRESLYLDGVEDVRDGVLYYTDELIDKVYKAFGVNLPKSVAWDDIEKVAAFLIDEIILKAK